MIRETFTFSDPSNIQNKQDPTILFENTLDREEEISVTVIHRM